MSDRYFTIPKCYPLVVDEDIWGYRHAAISHGTPHVSDHVSTDTGLLDKDGNSIMRAPRPMGFIWHE